jgi:hypothetical protein
MCLEVYNMLIIGRFTGLPYNYIKHEGKISLLSQTIQINVQTIATTYKYTAHH